MTYLDYGIEIVNILRKNGYSAYVVGGTVRDIYIGREVNDIDITTNARPNDVIKLFDKVVKTGIRYGTVTIIRADYKYEVTTFRKETTYLNNRKPDGIIFSDKIEEDLVRRDFTMNALVMDNDLKIIDYVNGKYDIDNKIIRAIGDPIVRFEEDALRMLRAFYFVSKLGFDIEIETLNAIKECKELINNISIERIKMEIAKLFNGKYVDKALKYLIETEFDSTLKLYTNGIKYIYNSKIRPNLDEFYLICFYLNGQVEDYRFSKIELQWYKDVYNLLCLGDEDYNRLIVYSNGLDICLTANKVAVLLGITRNKESEIKTIYEQLPITKTCDLVFKGQDILQLTDLKNAEVIGQIVDETKFNVIMGILENDYDILKEFALNMIKELEWYEKRDNKN